MEKEWIERCVASGHYLWTLHADEERRNDGFTISDIEDALLSGAILEQYPKDPRGPSCLVFGGAKDAPKHVVCGRNSLDYLVVITVYKPLPPRWKTPTERGEK